MAAAGGVGRGQHVAWLAVDRAEGETYVALTADALSIGSLHDWAVDPGCGAVVVFSGTVRDHSEGRQGVEHLEYEAYEEQAVPRMGDIAAEARRRWPDLGRLAVVHRTGRCELGEPTVVVAASAPHRAEAFEAARFAIDALKASVPIWKRERWDGGEDWGLAATDLVDASSVDATSGGATSRDATSGGAPSVDATSGDQAASRGGM